MLSVRIRIIGLVSVLLVILVGAAVLILRPSYVPSDPRLKAFVRSRPTVDIVFTSRSDPASLEAAAPEGEGFTAPGRPLWQAREGRLRLLTTEGTVHELTWGKLLPDGGTLIDVMSPSISLDGKRVLFAGRKANDPFGRFRLYQINLDGSDLRPLTGEADDSGCVALPPLRFRADGSRLSDEQRRRIDYDDVDPIELNPADGTIVFASSRMPDLGRDHARRSTQLWLRRGDGSMEPLTANRNNDRRPFLLRSGYIAFSMWSRNREVISADGREIRPSAGSEASLSQPTDLWEGAFVQVPGGHFGMLLKPNIPVWHLRPLFVNRLVFMTRAAANAGLCIAQAAPGWIGAAPSSADPSVGLPHAESPLRWGPDHDREGRRLWTGTPSPAPPNLVLLTGAPLRSGSEEPISGDYGLYVANADWPTDKPADPHAVELTLLFDDPELVDAEPVAVYPRRIVTSPLPKPEPATDSQGTILATTLDSANAMGDLPGQRTDAGNGPIFTSPPSGAISTLKIYAAHRDRFDDPVQSRIIGGWELLTEVPIRDGTASFRLPSASPSILAGFTADGRIVQWETAARDRTGKRGRFYAFAGDHYSLTKPNGRHFCVGCHPGHSGLALDTHHHAEIID